MTDFFTVMAASNSLHKQAIKIDPHFPTLMASFQGKSAQAWNDFEVYVAGHWEDIVAGVLALQQQIDEKESRIAELEQEIATIKDS